MKHSLSVKSSLIRLVLILLIVGQAIIAPMPALGSSKVRMNIKSSHNNIPNSVTGMIAEPDFDSNEGGRIKLNWIAPKDGGNQSVFSYIIKYATFSVTSLSSDTTAWWNHPNCLTVLDSELPQNWGRKAVVSYGNTETISITGLQGGDYYYFGIKSIDRYFRKSDYDVSLNSLISQTSAYATTPPWTPYVIDDLTGISTGERGIVSLKWTVPSFLDEGVPVAGNIKQPGEYCIQYSTYYNPAYYISPSMINKPNLTNNWDYSSRVFVSTKDVSTGDDQQYLLTGLQIYTTYYVHVFTRNEWPDKWSQVSVPVVEVFPYVYVDPIETITAVASASADENIGSYVDLTWTAPDDENFAGVKICYSDSVYPDNPNWSDSILITGLVQNQTTTYRHVQLVPRSNYYYTVYSVDKYFVDPYRYSYYNIKTSTYVGHDLISPDAPSGITSLITLNMPEGGEDEYTITLNWTNPSATPIYKNADFVGTKLYYSTSTQVQSLQSELAVVPGINSETKAYVHSNLTPYTTYYYSLASYDVVPNTSTWQTWMLFHISEKYVPPAKPVIVASLVNAVKNPNKGCYTEISWRTKDAVTPPLEGVDITYRTDRYPAAPGDGTQIVRTPLAAGATYTTTINKLRPNTTYYMILTAYSSYGVYSRQTKHSFVTNVPWTDDVAPFYPVNLAVELVGESGVKLTWDKVKYSQDMTKFANIYFPEMDELYGYEIYRSVKVNDDSSWAFVGNVIGQTTEFSDTVSDKKLYYYKVRAYDASYNYSDSFIINTEGSIIIMGEDGSYLAIPEELAGLLNKNSNTYGKDIIITFARKDTEEVGPIPKSIEWEVFAVNESDSGISLDRFNKFNFPKSVSKTEPGVEFSMSYAVSDANNTVKKSISPEKLKGMPLEEVEKWLSIFYFNGVEWLKLGSTPDKDLKVLKTQIKLAGKYQLRKSAPATEFTFYSVMPKIITPNGDEQNDRAMFRYANPKTSSIEIKIFDINGALVKKLGDFEKSSDIHGDYIYWDGADEDGVTVPPGVYLYQLDGEGKVINGTVVVAR